MTLLQQIDRDRLARQEQLRTDTRMQLQDSLRKLLPNQPVIVFGSLVHTARFNEDSDIDLAIEAEPPGLSIFRLSSLLAEQLGRRVDIVLLPECRFRDRVLREGELWTQLA